jgi:hypothetical protein
VDICETLGNGEKNFSFLERKEKEIKRIFLLNAQEVEYSITWQETNVEKT